MKRIVVSCCISHHLGFWIPLVQIIQKCAHGCVGWIVVFVPAPHPDCRLFCNKPPLAKDVQSEKNIVGSAAARLTSACGRTSGQRRVDNITTWATPKCHRWQLDRQLYCASWTFPWYSCAIDSTAMRSKPHGPRISTGYPPPLPGLISASITSPMTSKIHFQLDKTHEKSLAVHTAKEECWKNWQWC